MRLIGLIVFKVSLSTGVVQDEADEDVPHNNAVHPVPRPLAMLAPRLARVAMAGPLLPAAPAERSSPLSTPPHSWRAAVQSGAGRSTALEPLLPVSVSLAPLEASLLDR